MKADGIKKWLEGCDCITVLDMSQTQVGKQGLYKQANVIRTPLIDGSEIRLENWYILFTQNAQLPREREKNEEILERFEDWIFEQNLTENFPEIGYDVSEVSCSNGYYLQSREEDEAVYQSTISIEYMKERTNE